MGIARDLGLKDNPFEHYNAEKEPHIVSYAVRPPYLETISQRARGLSSFILFGDRGAGKSATRLTVFKEEWAAAGEESVAGRPFVVNLTDYTQVLDVFKRGELRDKDLCVLAAFYVIEQMFAWLSSLEDEERAEYLGRLDEHDEVLIIALLQGLYLNVPEMDRDTSTSEAFKLLGSAWTTKSKVWAKQRWGALSGIFADVLNLFAKKYVDKGVDVAGSTERILASLVGDSANAPRAILSKLVELSRMFGFSGVCVLVDKLDETDETDNSVDATARLIYPLLANIQLLEVDGFSWVFFVWGGVEEPFSNRLKIRLDKIANARIRWEPEQLFKMLDRRLEYYSDGVVDFSGVFGGEVRSEEVFERFRLLSLNSPRELIRLMDTLFREHDARGTDAPNKIDAFSVELAQDKYAMDSIRSWYKKDVLNQLYRLGKVSFTNKDVQGAFRIGSQGARTKVLKWVDIGLVRQNGTVALEGLGKPSYLYEVSDPRVARVIERRLDDLVGVPLEPAAAKDEDFVDGDSDD
ncbi:hypothetical protein DFO61_3373 [Ectopseudomonas oleovorans]|uniref:ATP-binding protein n=1 Tax=Ectopseudomonas oleovorans TaxID=301 RepID=A0A397MGN8_ECTOL|nr:hypothetical protein [Pseudomonas oleovorans]RIA22683.1 hypothetical protein DFO61_3373 [Pseudomonas oleovorans]